MSRFTLHPLTAYVRPESASAFKRRARKMGLSASGYLKQLIEREIAAPQDTGLQTIVPQIIFLSVAIDALLDRHPDRDLRPLVHEAWRRKVTPDDVNPSVGEAQDDV